VCCFCLLLLFGPHQGMRSNFVHHGLPSHFSQSWSLCQLTRVVVFGGHSHRSLVSCVLLCLCTNIYILVPSLMAHACAVCQSEREGAGSTPSTHSYASAGQEDFRSRKASEEVLGCGRGLHAAHASNCKLPRRSGMRRDVRVPI